MKLVARRLAWLLPLVLCACAHNANHSPQVQALAPPLEDTPPPPPDISPAALPSPAVNVPTTKEPVAVAPEPVKEKPRRHKQTAKIANAAQPGASAPASPQQLAEGAPVEESAIGNFETPEAPDQKKQTENSIAEIERGLNGLGRKLNDQEAKTSIQIREFLKEARTALASGDIEGAKTLTSKAKALLGELSQ
jgi:hypothetical protein